MTGPFDIDAAMTALHQAQQAILIAKAALAGETSNVLLISSTPGSYVSPYTAESPAEVAEDVPGWPPGPHLHQSSGGHGGCTFPGCPQGTLHPGYYEGYYDDQDAVS